MTDDLLERAAAIVRERYDGQSERATATEDRILAASGKRHRRGRLALIAIPLVAALLASAAWGTAGKNLRTWVQTLSEGEHSPSPPPTAKIVARSPHLAALVPSAPSSEPTTALPGQPAAPAAPEPLPAAPSARSQRLASPPKATSVRASPALEPSESEIDALYRAAHRAQFSGADPGQALLLWDRYLARAPNGSLSPEARYNRAIALARLGRKAEAATALEPFARGEYGGYRKTEANALLQVLRPAGTP
jgi:hypothetical protein